MGSAVSPAFSVEPPDQEDEKNKFEVEAPPAASFNLPHSMGEAGTRLKNMFTGEGQQTLPRTPGSDEEAVREGSGPAVAGLSTIGMAGMPIEALATRSLAPLAPLVKSAIGGLGGQYLGREAGGLAGHLIGSPEEGSKIGGTVGGIAGGLYGAAGGKIPTKASLMSLFNDEPLPQGWTGEETAGNSPVGSPLPAAEDFYAKRGADISSAMKQQPGAFAEPSPVANPGAPLPSADKFYEQRGNDITRAMRQQPEAFASPETPAVGGGAKPTPDVLRVPEPRSLLADEKVGYTASTPRRLLMGNALQGRPGAGDMLRNSGKTVIYTPAEGYPGPRVGSPMPEGNPTPFGKSQVASPAEEFLHSVSTGNEPEVEHVASPSGPRGNASGAPGGGGLEEGARLSGEKNAGVQYFRENPGGGRVPLEGQGRQDLKAGYGQKIIRVNGDGSETVLDEKSIRPGAARIRKPQ